MKQLTSNAYISGFIFLLCSLMNWSPLNLVCIIRQSDRRTCIHSKTFSIQKCHHVEKKLMSLRSGLVSWSNASDRWHCVLCVSLCWLWSILIKTFRCFQHIYLNVRTLVGGSYVCRVNDFLLSQERAINMWVMAVSNVKNRCGLRSADGREGFSLLPFLECSGFFCVIETFDYRTVLAAQSILCLPQNTFWSPQLTNLFDSQHLYTAWHTVNGIGYIVEISAIF